MTADPTHGDRYPLTISQWRTLQESTSEPLHILRILERAKENSSAAWISLATPEQIEAQWEYIVSLRSQKRELPLFGVPFAVKDNIDVAGYCTTAACPSFGTKAATTDSTVVARLREQGAIVLGKTNLDQFATGLVGTRSPYGAVRNPFDPERVSGGSSSGSAVVVSEGLVPFALGTDTAGSGRVPAGFNNIIGIKPTRGALSTHGVIPACRSLDCVSVFALTLDDASLVLQLTEGYDSQDAYSRARAECATTKVPRGILPSQSTLAVCLEPEWFGCSKHAIAYSAALEKAERLGWRLEPVDFSPLFEVAILLYEGPWVAERYTAIKEFLQTAPADSMDPVVRDTISKGGQFSAVDVFQSEHRRKELSRLIERVFGQFDGLLVPTAPIFPTLLEVKEEPFLVNRRLGMYTNFVNLMDWSAIAIPAGFREDNLPFGITLIGGPWEESRLLELSRQWLSDGPRLLGDTDAKHQETGLAEPASSDTTQLTRFNLSHRGAFNAANRDVWGPREKSMGNPWSPSNPSGTVILRLAENSLLHQEISDFIHTQMAILPSNHLTYSTGPKGSRRLRHAAAAFLTEEFRPTLPITANDIFATSGLAGAIDGLAWALCNEGDGILVPQPFYNGFLMDAGNRSNVKIVGIPYDGIEGFSGLHDLFRPDINKKALEVAFRKAKADGITIRALMISQPHNPLGRCYPSETLKEFVSFCGRHHLHFISDEIYAKSVFINPTIPNPVPFTSTLALDLHGIIDPIFVHVLYGASKDFCANGLRLGLVCTKNEGIMAALSSISIFSWSPHILQDVWASMLENKQWLENFMSRKTELMAENYRIATSFFSERGINYYEMNAGLFLWVDLRHLLLTQTPQSPSQSTHNELKVTSPDTDIHRQRELRLAEICAENGVLIAPGTVYVPEEFGWFRITFTVDKRALEEGLVRLWKSLTKASPNNLKLDTT